MVAAVVPGYLALNWAMAFWKSRAVFAHAYERPEAQAAGIWSNVKRLFRHRAIYPAVLILFMFQFAPGANTPRIAGSQTLT